MALYRPIADHAVLVEFGTAISDAAHAQVLALDQALTAHPFKGFREATPAFVNLLVDFKIFFKIFYIFNKSFIEFF